MNLYLVKLHVGKTNPNKCGADAAIVLADDGDRAMAQARKLAKCKTDFDPMFFSAHLMVQSAEFYVGWKMPEGVLFGRSRFVNERFPEEMMQ